MILSKIYTMLLIIFLYTTTLCGNQSEKIYAVMITEKTSCSQELSQSAILSFLQQTYANKQLIIISDDNFNYSHPDILVLPAEYTNNLRDFIIEKIPENSIIMLWNHDTWYHPNTLDELYNCFIKNNADLCCLTKKIQYDCKNNVAESLEFQNDIDQILMYRNKKNIDNNFFELDPTKLRIINWSNPDYYCIHFIHHDASATRNNNKKDLWSLSYYSGEYLFEILCLYQFLLTDQKTFVKSQELQAIIAQKKKDAYQQVYLENPIELITPNRFDIMAKYIYAKHREIGVENTFARELYRAHLAPWNAFNEDLPKPHFPHFDCAQQYIKKNTFQDFINRFNTLLDNIKHYGLDVSKSVIPLNQYGAIIDGAHRSAAAIYYKKPITCKIINIKHTIPYNAEFFRHCKSSIAQGVSEKYLDAMALNYAQLKSTTYIACIFPATSTSYQAIKNILNGYGNIVYEKEFKCNNNGPFNLIRLLYNNETWLGNWDNKFNGVWSKANNCFPQKSGIVKIILFESDNLELVKKAKKDIRTLCNIGNSSIHINDIHKETVLLARTFFVANSLHWLNNAQLKHCKNFERFMSSYKKWFPQYNIDEECCCVDTSAVLSAYGLRDCNDLDVIHHGYNNEIKILNTAGITSHNAEMHHHVYKKEDIIFNPEHHFYYFGVKFAALDVVKKMKEKRGEKKDIEDLKLIATLS